MSQRPRCQSSTRAGEPCNRRPTRGERFCFAHRRTLRAGTYRAGATQPDSGLYRQALSPDELELLDRAVAVRGLALDAATLRVKIDTALREGVELEALARAYDTLTKMLLADRKLAAEPDRLDALDQALDHLGTLLGTAL